MDESRKAKFEQLLNDTRDDIQELETRIEDELAEVKKRLATLQNQKKAQLIVYSGYCQLLGIENEFESEEDDDEDELD